jgi:Cu/Ag efflux pump CusA
VAQIQKTLPEGVVLEPFLDRTKMVNNAIGTVETNLLEGALNCDIICSNNFPWKFKSRIFSSISYSFSHAICSDYDEYVWRHRKFNEFRCTWILD